MSGYKRVLVAISETEYKRLHDVDMQNRFSNLPARQPVIEPARLDAIERMLSMFAERQLAFQEHIHRIGDEVGEVENTSAEILMENMDASLQQLLDNTNATMQQLQFESEDIKRQIHEKEDNLHDHIAARDELVQQQITAGLTAVRNDTHSLFQDFSEDMEFQIESIRQQQAGELAVIQKRLMSLSDDKFQKERIARYWLDSAITLREFVENEYDHHRFLPGAFNSTDVHLQQAEANLAMNMPEAALAAAQHLYFELSLKRLELENLTTHWQATYIDALYKLNDLFTYVLACRSIPAIENTGKELDLLIDLDRWSGEEYRSLVKEVRALRTRLQSHVGDLTLEELNTIISVRIPEFHQTLGNLVYKARWEVMNSQIRINIADIAIQALETQGFQVRDHGFSKGDMKDSYKIALFNVEDSQVIIHVKPLPNLEVGSDLTIESKDREKRSESELRSRSSEIIRSLASYGLRVGPLSEVQDASLGRISTPPIQVRESLRPERLLMNSHD